MNHYFQLPRRFISGGHRSGRGFTLIEMMVAMLLGLIVIAGVSSVFLANLRSYHSNTALGNVQSNARIAYAMMARDIRQAGLTGCNSKSGRIANVLANGPKNAATPDWWADWDNALHGYAPGSDPAVPSTVPQVAGTDSVMLLSVEGQGVSMNEADAVSGSFTLNEGGAGLESGDIIIVCNPDHSAIMQVTKYDSGSKTVTHATDKDVPGNCSIGLGYPTSCATSEGNTYTFTHNSRVAQLAAHDWYIGKNSIGGSSLYRIALENSGGTIKAKPQEMVRNVTNMQISYHVGGGATFVQAGTVTDWAGVDAVRVTFTLQSASLAASTDGKPLSRSFTTTTTIRNRLL